MSRRNQGPRLRWFEERGAYYITWTVNGRSHKCSTSTRSLEDAQIFLGQWLGKRSERSHGGPSDPAQAFVTDILTYYATEHGPKVVAPRAICSAIAPLTQFW